METRTLRKVYLDRYQNLWWIGWLIIGLFFALATYGVVFHASSWTHTGFLAVILVAFIWWLRPTRLERW